MSSLSGRADFGPMTRSVPTASSSSSGSFVKLTDYELQVVPLGEAVSRHTHRGGRTVVTQLRQPLVGQLAYEFYVRLVGQCR